LPENVEMNTSIPLWQSVLQEDTIDKEIMWYLAFSHIVVAGDHKSFYIVTVFKSGEVSVLSPW
jgi:hypothetical protein